MLQALILVAGIALADSVNPATIGPGVVLAMSGRHPSRRVLEFTAGAFMANFVGGTLLVVGPGQWLLSLLPKPSHHTKHLGEIVGGVLLVVAAIVVWFVRHRLGERQLPGTRAQPGHAFTAGATVMLVELPTAFPYFAAIAAIVGLDKPLSVQLALVVLFNVIFLGPLVAIAVVVRFSESVRRSVIAPVADWLATRWPVIFAGVLGVIGTVVTVIGAAGLARA